MHKLNSHRRYSKCLPECSTQSCKRGNQEAVALQIVSRGISFQPPVCHDDSFASELGICYRCSHPLTFRSKILEGN